MDLWITVVASIVSALLGAAAMWMVTHRQLNRQETYDKNKIKLERLERLHQMVSRYTYGMYSMMNESAIKGLQKAVSVIVPPELMPPRAQQEIDMPDDDEMRSIVRIHEPSLSTEMEALLQAGGDLGQMIYQAERATLLTMLDEKESQKFSTQTMRISLKRSIGRASSSKTASSKSVETTPDKLHSWRFSGVKFDRGTLKCRGRFSEPHVFLTLDLNPRRPGFPLLCVKKVKKLSAAGRPAEN